MKRSALKIFYLLVFIFPLYNLNAGELISKDQALLYAMEFVQENALPSFSIVAPGEEIINDSGELISYSFDLSPDGFVVISAFETHYPVIAYSFKNNFTARGTSEDPIAIALIHGMAEADKHSAIHNRPITNISEFEIGPFVQLLWGQVNCYDNNNMLVNVTNYYTPNNYAAGCVAISMATLLKHYHWPVNGTGSHTNTDNWGSSTGTYSADFGNSFYRWINMLDKYKNQASTDWQREAAGLLAFHSAISLNMDFEYNGSTSNVNRIPNAGRNYFRYSSQERLVSSQAFWPLLDTNMMHEIPVILAVEANNGAGHSVVCDGLRITDDSIFYYHLNMGWWGTANGWYRLREGFSAGGYTAVKNGIFYFLPIPALSTPRINGDSTSTYIRWQYPEKNIRADTFEVQQKTGEGIWATITNSVTDTFLLVEIEDLSEEIYFRLRAKAKGKWSNYSWSEELMLVVEHTFINEIEILHEVNAWPQPFNEFLNIRIPEQQKYPVSIAIYSVEGMLIHTMYNLTPGSYKINTSDWKPGFYIATINHKSKKKTLKLIKTT